VGISEISVAVAVACPHRAEAFEACKWAMDTLKATVPIWKQEIYEDSAVWIEGGKRFEASRRDQ
jgi:molybdopterin synthase catalytic subunit